jgi:hypothetical protein
MDFSLPSSKKITVVQQVDRIKAFSIPYLRHCFLETPYLGLTWHTHVFAKRKQLGISLTKMYWLLGRKSKLSVSNKLLIYKAILKPIWTYGIQLWGTTSNSNIAILERFQPKVLCLIVNAPWYVPNSVIRKDLRIPSVKEEIDRLCGLVVRVLGYRSGGPDSIPVTTRKK